MTNTRRLNIDAFGNHVNNAFNALTMIPYLFNTVNTSYPPYNVIRVEDNHSKIEVACAGFSENELAIKVDGDILSIKGRKNVGGYGDASYSVRNLAFRDFELRFRILPGVEIEKATYVDGLLEIDIINKVKEKDSVFIPINGNKQFLTE